MSPSQRTAQASPCADLDGNGEVNVTDLLALLAAFGSSAAGDTNSDGETNVTDLLALLAAFGQSSCTPGGAGSGCLTADVTQISVSGAGASEWDGVYLRQVDDRHPADGARVPPLLSQSAR